MSTLRPAHRRTLTDRQREVLDFIEAYIAERHYPPSHRDIGAHFGISSPNGVVGNLTALAKKGAIVYEVAAGRKKVQYRTIRVLVTRPTATAQGGGVALRLPQRVLTPDEAEGLARQLLEAAGQARGGGEATPAVLEPPV